jgi:hypothetical protein
MIVRHIFSDHKSLLNYGGILYLRNLGKAHPVVGKAAQVKDFSRSKLLSNDISFAAVTERMSWHSRQVSPHPV